MNITRIITENGSQITTRENASHVIVGYTPQGFSAYYRRNVAQRDVEALVRQAEMLGWTNIAAVVEGF